MAEAGASYCLAAATVVLIAWLADLAFPRHNRARYRLDSAPPGVSLAQYGAQRHGGAGAGDTDTIGVGWSRSAAPRTEETYGRVP
ncbi:MAG: hypothetical protein GTN78_01970 [Gemmatimonadales bacterium]|nr:hypothetical protein [Gemmatimonadales bacterium]NIN10728.1 hypothetical protein [Gemmatimonadales bacterium]NIQ98958.1 hypothetical protein [Gemmatimonadales bacterium]NIS63777.1 hypothetical protein [Gemmatimonadales bacterium]